MSKNRALARARRLPAVLAAAATGLVTVAAVVAPGATSTAGAATKGTVNFDAVMDLTGTYGQYGGFQLAGDKAMVAIINKNGGINGKKVVLHYQDDQSNASTAALAAQQLLQQYPAIVMDSGTITPTCNAVLPVTTKAKVISFCSGTFLQTQFPYAFALIPTSTLQSQAELTSLKQLTPSKKFAIVTDQSSGDLAGTKVTSQNASKYGLTTVGYITTPTGATDYTAAIQQAKNAGAGTILLHSVVASSVVAFMRDIQTLGWKTVKVLVNDEAVSTAVMTNIPPAVEKQFYAYTPRLYVKGKKSTNPLLTQFAKQLASQGPITDIGISAYHGDALNLSKWAMTKAKTTTTMMKVLKQLESMNKTTIPVGQFLAYQNPKYSKTNHGLPQSANKTYWGIIRPGTPQTGRYTGYYITTTTGTK